MAEAKKIDPFDVEALEKSLNDSATRVSAIWISFLTFSLYLLIAATTVTQRQLFLAEPLKLPVLNIDLPIWGFFFLAPILFVILHAYVLLQVLLLGRTAAAYNVAVSRTDLSPEENMSLRQRLANTVFAQIFAGSPRERGGLIGSLLRGIARITLAISPVLILLAFQFSFLAYHSHIATWTHRLLILVELAAFFLIWPLALDAKKDFNWTKLKHGLKRLSAFPKALSIFLLWPLIPERRLGFDRPAYQRRREFLRLRRQAVPVTACLLFVFLSMSLATFPGEPHVNLFTGQSLSSVQCERWVQQKFQYADLRFDRFDLPQIDVVDDEKLSKIVKYTSERTILPSQGERTQNFRGRDFNCSDLSWADLRRVDLTGARLSGSNLDYAALGGASLNDAHLRDSSLKVTQLQDASLNYAELQNSYLTGALLQGASLKGAQLQSAHLYLAELQGAILESAKLHGALLERAQLQGASLQYVELPGASLKNARLQGALLELANLQGASLDGAQLQGAVLNGAQLQGAFFNNARLQGADFKESEISLANFSGAYVWRARGAACQNARVADNKLNPIGDEGSVQPAPNNIMKFIERSIAEIPDSDTKEEARKRMRTGLIVDSDKNDTAEIAQAWSECEQSTKKLAPGSFDGLLAKLLLYLACDNGVENRKAVANGIAFSWVVNYPDHKFSALLARGLLSQDGKDCASTKDFNDLTKSILTDAAAEATEPPPRPQ